MSASPCDVAYGCDVVPSAQWANITSLATVGSNIITNKVSNITFAQAKTSLYLPPESKIQYNALYLAGRIVCKKDEKTSSFLI
jgi:hypothetical protein